jgi:hypothetical protein
MDTQTDKQKGNEGSSAGAGFHRVDDHRQSASREKPTFPDLKVRKLLTR